MFFKKIKDKINQLQKEVRDLKKDVWALQNPSKYKKGQKVKTRYGKKCYISTEEIVDYGVCFHNRIYGVIYEDFEIGTLNELEIESIVKP